MEKKPETGYIVYGNIYKKEGGGNKIL